MEARDASDLPEQPVPVDLLDEQRALQEVKHALFEERFSPITLGRYVLTERIGAGAAGIVYRAFDPDLRRQVAIKVLRTDGGTTHAEARLRREALAIARLAHPHVIAIFDVGTLGEGDAAGIFGRGVYLVMELVEGRSFDAWLNVRGRTDSEILDAFMQAGRGLQAAHAAGIVHRDFKPSNAVVGDDGRLRVLDFGLAALHARDESDTLTSGAQDEPPEPDAEADDETLTHDGTVMGTPRFMAPEQHAGRVCDARSDQYAFCVALWTALSGEAPFRRDIQVPLAIQKRRGPPRVPPRAARLAWIFPILAKGLDPDPQGRWPGMGALLAAIEGRRHRRRRTLVGTVAVVGAAAIVAVTSGLLGANSSSRLACDEVTVEALWSEERQAATQARFSGSELPFADESWRRVEARLDRFARGCVERSRALCAALAEGQIQPEEFSARVSCLGQQRRRFDALTSMLAEAEGTTIARAGMAVESLPSPSRCTDVAATPTWTRSADPARSRIDAKLARAESAKRLGRTYESAQLYTEALRLASEVEDQLGQAHAHAGLSSVAVVNDRPQVALEHARKAYAASERSEDARFAVDQLIALAWVEDPKAAQVHLEVAQERIADLEASTPEPELQARLATARAKVLQSEGELEAASRQARRSIDLTRRFAGADSPKLLPAAHQLAWIASAAGDAQTAAEVYEQAIDVAEHSLGPTHPTTTALQANLGAVYAIFEFHEEAVPKFEASLERRAIVDGHESKGRLHGLCNLVNSLVALERLDEATRVLSAVESVAHADPRSDKDELYFATTKANVELARGDCRAALETLDGVKTEMEASDEGLLKLPFTEQRARCKLELGLVDEALADQTWVVAQLDRQWGAMHPATLRSRWRLAQIQAARGDERDAVALVEHMLRVCEQSPRNGRWCAKAHARASTWPWLSPDERAEHRRRAADDASRRRFAEPRGRHE